MVGVREKDSEDTTTVSEQFERAEFAVGNFRACFPATTHLASYLGLHRPQKHKQQAMADDSAVVATQQETTRTCLLLAACQSCFTMLSIIQTG